MAQKNPAYTFENAIQIHKKLILTEKQLIAVLEQIDKELNQTDVEWLHLKSLVESRKGVEKNPVETPKETSTEQAIKDKHHIDDQSVNATQLDLSLGILDMISDIEDSD